MYTYTCHHQITLWLKDITRIDRSDVMYYFFNVVLLKLSKIYLRHLISVNNARQSIEFFLQSLVIAPMKIARSFRKIQ